MTQHTQVSAGTVGAKRTSSILPEPLESRRLLSASYFVAPGGSDKNAGTIDAPFQTIQHAADLAGPGDTVEIRGGVYRETVRPAQSGDSGSPVTFEAYNGENAVIDGADPVTGWSNEKGNVYTASDPGDLGFGNNQVFVNGRAMNEARWPNTGLNVSKPTLAVAGGGGGSTLIDDALAGTGVDWTGGVIHIASGQGWVAQTATISGDSGNRITFNLAGTVDPHGGIKAGNAYYLTGKFQALDAPGEWFRDSDGTLHLWAPDGSNPDSNSVEAKHRLYGFDLSGKSNISIKGINLFACTIVANGSNDVAIDNITAQYVSQFVKLSNGWQPGNNTGIILNGNNNSVSNSVIAYSAGDGIFLNGRNNVARNNVVHDCDYTATDTAGIRTWGSGDILDHNTVYNCGRDGIKFAMTTNTQVTYNLVHDVMLQTSDGGAIYTFGTNGAGSTIAYNRCYNIHSFGWGAAGLYLDNGSHNFSVHNNDVFNVDIGLKMNPNNFNESIVDNTLLADAQSVSSYGSQNMSGSQFVHNVFNNKLMIGGSVKMVANVSSGDTAGVGFAGASIGDPLQPVLIQASVRAATATASPDSGLAPVATSAAAGAPVPLTDAGKVQADVAKLATDEQGYRDAVAADGAAARAAMTAAKASIVVDRAKIKTDRGNRLLLPADRSQLKTDRLKLRAAVAAGKAKLVQDKAGLVARIRADKVQLVADKRKLRKNGKAKQSA